MKADRLRILVIEDNHALRTQMAMTLEARGHQADFAADGRTGLKLALAQPPDVVVLDLNLPGLDGLQVCERLRAEADRHIPVLMLTARDTLDDKLKGFNSGADDYLVKPFAGEELVARCIALAQRHRVGEKHVIRIGPLHIDRRTGEVRRDDRVLQLHQTSQRILLALAEVWPRTLTRSELIQRLWGDEAPASDPLRSHMYLLRQELDKPSDLPMLKTVHGVGFRLDADL